MLGNNHLSNIIAEVITIKTLFASAKPSIISNCRGEFQELSNKSFSKDAASIFKLFDGIVEIYHIKGKESEESKLSGLFRIASQQSLALILNKHKTAISMSTFDFATLYTKIPHDKLLHVLNIWLALFLAGGARDCYCL